MRDIGTMGEKTFGVWCADAGLVANGSRIDKTGWDYFVEFPFNFNTDVDQVHKSAIECKIQVKSTDKQEGKVQVSLSNLRRLITAQMPSFFVFIEFDGKSEAQQGYIVHVDHHLISHVLKRLHQFEQSDKDNRFNKRKMTIHYDESNIMSSLDGTTLKKDLLSHIGNDMAKYVESKKAHLESTGFENGFAQINFSTDGKENVRKLIDVSLGLEKSAPIKSFKGVKTRFGIESKSPFLDAIDGRLEMPKVEPTSTGEIRFKEDKLSAGYSFPAKLYVSPFNKMAPHELVKARVEGDFFDLKFYPYTGKADYSFSFGEGVRLEIHQFRDALKLLRDFSTPSKSLYSEFIFKNFPNIESRVEGHVQEFPFSKELNALESACDILSYFDVRNGVDASLNEIAYAADEINQFKYVIRSDREVFSVEFDIEDGKLDSGKKVACINLISVHIGSHIFGIFLVIAGEIFTNNKTGKYQVFSNSCKIEKKILSKKDSVIHKEDLLAAIPPIEKKYSDEYQVIVMNS